MKFEVILFLIIAALHLMMGSVHYYAHVVADVQNTPLELLFILLVVTISPWAAVYLAWKGKIRTGAAAFSLSMAASFLFGYLLHFVMESPDHYANVVETHRPVFFHSAVGLALVEFSGFVFAANVYLRNRNTPAIR